MSFEKVVDLLKSNVRLSAYRPGLSGHVERLDPDNDQLVLFLCEGGHERLASIQELTVDDISSDDWRISIQVD